MAVAQPASSILRPFNFVTASPLGNEVGRDHANHLTSFLRLGPDGGLLDDAMASFIASTILLDANPPKMHRKWCTGNFIQDTDFDPKTIYDVIYHPSYFRSLARSSKERSYAEHDAVKQTRDQEQSIKRHLATVFVDMVSSGKTAMIYRGRRSKATAPASGVFAGSQKAHFPVDIPYVMSAYRSTGMRYPLWIANIISGLVSCVIPEIAPLDSSLCPLANKY